MASIKIDESQAASNTRNIAVDEIATEDYQKIKLHDGTAGSTAEIQGTTAFGLEVDVTRAPVLHAIVDSGAITSTPSGTQTVAGSVTSNASQTTTASIAMTSGNAVSLTGLTNQASALFNTTGTWTGTLAFEVQYDGTNWITLTAVNLNGSIGFTTITSQTNNAMSIIAGATGVRLRCSVTGTGTAVITITTTSAATMVQFSGALSGVTTVSTVTNVATIGTSVTPGTAAANLGKAEDAGHVSGDVGVLALGVRNDLAATDMTSANADNATVSVDIKGRVYTTPVATRLTMTSAGLTIVTTPYVAGDQMGTEMTATNAVRISGGSALIIGATCTSDAAATPAVLIELNLYNAATTPAADNAAAAWSDADTQKLCGVLQFPAMQFGTNNGWTQAYLPNPLAINCAATSLFGDFIARGGVPVFTAVTDLKVQLTVIML